MTTFSITTAPISMQPTAQVALLDNNGKYKKKHEDDDEHDDGYNKGNKHSVNNKYPQG